MKRGFWSYFWQIALCILAYWCMFVGIMGIEQWLLAR